MSAEIPAPPHALTFAQACRMWLKIGCISFGGPAGQIALLQHELVEERRLISERRFTHALNYCMLLPGPEAQQLATYLGWLMHGVRGGIAAGALFVLPSLLLFIALSWLYVRYGNHPLAGSVLYGIKPAVVALVFYAAYRLSRRTLHNPLLVAIALAAFLALAVFSIAFPYVIGTAALIGWLAQRHFPQYFRVRDEQQRANKPHPPALIDDHTALPAHARFAPLQLGGIILIALTLGVGLFALLFMQFGWQHNLTQMSWFFTKAALLTFGGAYAVLPYVHQGAVEHYGWLTSLQMLDGLALGESTPGPLIMIVAFVGFLAEAIPASGSDTMLSAGAAGACVATFFTFLPSFIFILAGAPLIEATHKQPQLTAPLTAISAAVVGVIVSLGVQLARAVFIPASGSAQTMDWIAVCLTLAALAFLIRHPKRVLPMLMVGALAGYVLMLTLGA